MAKKSICTIEDCGKPHKGHGYCNAHYIMFKKHGDPLGGKKYFTKGEPCRAEGCLANSDSGGFCSSHRHKMQRYGDPLGGATWKKGQAEKFVSDLVSQEHEECVKWPYSTDSKKGYGLTSINGFKGAHRYVCAVAHGKPPTPEHQAAHSCGKGHEGCVNPKHLRWATAKENQADRVSHGTWLRGEAVYNAKVTAEQVLLMRSLRPTHTLSDLSKRFGISICNVSKICRGECWAWL